MLWVFSLPFYWKEEEVVPASARGEGEVGNGKSKSSCVKWDRSCYAVRLTVWRMFSAHFLPVRKSSSHKQHLCLVGIIWKKRWIMKQRREDTPTLQTTGFILVSLATHHCGNHVCHSLICFRIRKCQHVWVNYRFVTVCLHGVWWVTTTLTSM